MLPSSQQTRVNTEPNTSTHSGVTLFGNLTVPRSRPANIHLGLLVGLPLAIALEGALRKWVLPSEFHGVAYFAKDVLALLIVLSYKPARCHTARLMAMIALANGVLLLIPFVIGATIEPLAALVIYKNAVLWPLLGSRLAGNLSPRHLRVLTVTVLVLSAVEGTLAVAQYLSPPNSAINRYTWTDDVSNIAVFGRDNRVRVTGTFSYITGLSTFAAFAGTLLLSLYVYNPRRARSLWYAAGAVASAIAVVCTGSRAPLVITLIAVMLAVLATRRFRVALRITVSFAVLLVGFGFTNLSDIASNYLDRVQENQGEAAGRIGTDLSAIGSALTEAPLGSGLGNQSTVRYIRQAAAGNDLHLAEDNRERISTEAGLPGIAAFVISYWIFCRVLIKQYWERAPDSRFLITSVGAVGAAILITGAPYYDHVAAGLFWLVLPVALTVAMSEERRPSWNRRSS